jgi:hypothetical protein
VNSWFHLVTSPGRHAGRNYKRDIIEARPVGRQAGDRISV